MVGKLVCTTLGNSIIADGRQVLVHVAGNKFVKKSVEDVNVGDQVVYNKEFVTTSLEELAPILERSMRYRHAKEVLHEENVAGLSIPKHRTFLLRGLARQGVLRSPDLDARILKEIEPDFSTEEYQIMKNHIFELINPNFNPETGENRNRTHAAIDDWVRGETIAIHSNDWNLYRLLDPLNSDFHHFDDKDPSTDSFFRNYRLYMTVRRTIKRYLAECKGEKKVQSKNEAEKASDHLSIAPEIQLVVDYFINDIDRQYAAARVTSLEDLNPEQNSPVTGHRSRLSLSAGVINTLKENKPITLTQSDGTSSAVESVDMVEIATHNSILTARLRAQAHYLFWVYSTQKNLPSPQAKAIAAALSTSLFHTYNSEGKVKGDFLKRADTAAWKTREEYTGESLEEFIKGTEKFILDGGADKISNLPDGSFLHLLETVHKIRQILPAPYIEHLDAYVLGADLAAIRSPLGVKVNPKLLRNLFYETRDKLRKYGFQATPEECFLLNNYPISNVAYFEDFGGQILTQRISTEDLMKFSKSRDADKVLSDTPGIAELYWVLEQDIRQNPQEYKPILKQLLDRNMSIWTEKEIRSILDLYKLPEELFDSHNGVWIPNPELDQEYGRMKQELALERKLREAQANLPKPRDFYRTASGEQICLDSLSTNERKVYDALAKAKARGTVNGVYEAKVAEVFEIPSKNKLARKLDNLQQSGLFRIYEDMRAPKP